MTDRRWTGGFVARIVGLGVLAVGATTIAIVLVWVSSDLQVRVNEFWETQNGNQEPIDQATYDRWNVLSANSYTLLGLVTPLLIGAIGAAFALLAVLALRWERARAGQPAADTVEVSVTPAS